MNIIALLNNPKGRVPRACPWVNEDFALRASSEAGKKLRATALAVGINVGDFL